MIKQFNCEKGCGRLTPSIPTPHPQWNLWCYRVIPQTFICVDCYQKERNEEYYAHAMGVVGEEQ